jgi:cytochrome oxidase Cu insertion factor (SCO1/SenC/PrrC family)
MDHSAVIYMLDRNAKVTGSLAYSQPTPSAVSMLEDLIHSS